MKKICILFTLMLLASCTPPGTEDAAQHAPAVITGTILDMDENPIEHIRISLKHETDLGPVEVFTSSEGKFRCEIGMARNEEAMTIILSLEDIDGEDNGGLFESHSESVLFERQDDKPTEMNLVFHLNRATVSESSPQS